MRAIHVDHVGGPERLVLQEVAQPQLTSAPDREGDGEVVVGVHLAGVNYIDVYHRTGRYPLPTPFTPGVEGVGVIRACSPTAGERGLAVVQRVGWVMTPGSYAEAALVPASKVIPLPDDIDDEAAVALLVQGLTAHYLAVDTYRLAPGEIAVVHAGAGGVGWLLIQLATALGAVVIATGSTPEKCRLCRAAGAQVAVGYDDVGGAVDEVTDGVGAHVVYDGVGAATFPESLRLLRRRGTLVVYGAASGPVPPFDLGALMPGSPYLTRPSLADYIVADDLQQRARAVFTAYRARQLRPQAPTRYPLADAARAHRDLESRATSGKLVLTVTA